MWRSGDNQVIIRWWLCHHYAIITWHLMWLSHMYFWLVGSSSLFLLLPGNREMRFILVFTSFYFFLSLCGWGRYLAGFNKPVSLFTVNFLFFLCTFVINLQLVSTQQLFIILLAIVVCYLTRSFMYSFLKCLSSWGFDNSISPRAVFNKRPMTFWSDAFALSFNSGSFDNAFAWSLLAPL